MTELEGLIRFWEATLKHAWFLLDSSIKIHIENTVRDLKELQARQAKDTEVGKEVEPLR